MLSKIIGMEKKFLLERYILLSVSCIYLLNEVENRSNLNQSVSHLEGKFWVLLCFKRYREIIFMAIPSEVGFFQIIGLVCTPGSSLSYVSTQSLYEVVYLLSHLAWLPVMDPVYQWRRSSETSCLRSLPDKLRCRHLEPFLQCYQPILFNKFSK